MFTGIVVVVEGRIESWKPRARSRARSRTKATTEFGPVPFPRGNGAGQRRWFFSGGRLPVCLWGGSSSPRPLRFGFSISERAGRGKLSPLTQRVWGLVCFRVVFHPPQVRVSV